MKKKPENKIIKVHVHIENSPTVYTFRVGVHTFVKHFENMIAEELGLDMLRTHLLLRTGHSHGRMDSGKTLAQYGLSRDAGEHVFCRIEKVACTKLANAKTDIKRPLSALDGGSTQKLGALDMTYRYPVAQGPLAVGVNLEAVCLNKRCINYNRPLLYPLGVGEFDVYQLLQGLKCQDCPYKDIGQQPRTFTTQIKLNNCLYTCYGFVHKKGDVVSHKHDIGVWVNVQGQDSEYWKKIMHSHNWTQFYIKAKYRNHQPSSPMFL